MAAQAGPHIGPPAVEAARTWNIADVNSGRARLLLQVLCREVLVEGGQPGVHDMGIGEGADLAVQRGALRGNHGGEGGVRQARVDDALHERAPVIVLDEPQPLRAQHTRVQTLELAADQTPG